MTQFLGVIPQSTFVAEFMNIALHLLDDPYLTGDPTLNIYPLLPTNIDSMRSAG